MNEQFVGKKFGKLSVEKFSHRNKRGQSHWLCKCDCGKQKTIRGDHLLNKATKSCGCNQQGAGNHRWNGCGEIGGWVWNNYKINASRRNIPFKITVKDMWTKFLEQNRKCALTGELLQFSTCQSDNNGRTASLDRIDNTRGYEINNIQWVTKTINMAKGKLSQSDFLMLCQQVTSYETSKLHPVIP